MLLLAAMSTRFATTASLSAIQVTKPMSVFHEAVLTNGVQASFVAGTLTSVLLGPPDRLELRRFLSVGAALACVASLVTLTLKPTSMALPLLSLVWGVSVIADSAQFSASVAELSEPAPVGTMVTMQTCAGFLLTMASIQMIAVAVEIVGWRYTFVGLAIRPALGIVAMARLRRSLARPGVTPHGFRQHNV